MQHTYYNVAVAGTLGAILVFTGCGQEGDSSASWRQTQETPGAMPTPSDAPFVAASLAWDVPAEWEYREPASNMRNMRKGEFVISGGGGDAELVFFHFGSGQGGGVEANLARWARAMQDENGEPVQPEITVIEGAEMATVSAAYVGTYLSGPPMGEKIPQAGSMMLGAVVEGGPEGSVFLRLVGPKATVQAVREQWETMLASVRSAGG